MKTTTTRITAVALATAALCWHQASHAAATPEQLRSVTLYANVSIQEDSTSSWGPWAEFEPTAAGNNPPVAAPRVSTDPYRPLAQITQPGTTPPIDPVAACAGGSICGFGIFRGGDLNDPDQSKPLPDFNAFRLNGTVGSQGETGSALLPQTIQLEATVLSSTDASFRLPASGDLNLTAGYGRFLGETPGGFHYANNNLPTNAYQIGADPQRAGSFYSPEQIEAINFKLVTYVQGSSSMQGSWGVIGYTTTDASMATIRGVTNAEYNGTDHYGTNVNVKVNFNAGSWTGSWNGGGDSNVVSTRATTSGGTMLTGGVGFTAGGTVVGSTFTSNTVGTTDPRATVTGTVQGAFFGPAAAAAGGVVDITKTVLPSLQQPAGVGNATPQTVSVNPSQGYTGRYVAPFIVTRGGNDRRQ